MAMDFMVPRVLLPNRLCYLLCCYLLLQACREVDPSMHIVSASHTGIIWNNGIVHYNDQAFSGRLYQLHTTGDTAVVASYMNGRLHGWEYKWYPGGKLAEQRFYVNGKKEGIHEGWRADGSKRFEYHFSGDEHEGVLKEWFDNGTLARLFHYSKGHEDGRQQMWWEDGRVRANYIVVNGERFGLVGQKLCKNYFR